MARQSKPMVAAVISKMKSHLAAFASVPFDACWEWAGTIRSGYGKIHVNVDGQQHTYSVHRVSMYIKEPNDDPEMCVIHSCDNPRCFNPAHLSWGSHTDNMQDKVRKGRGPDYSKIVVRGDRHGSKTKPARVSKGVGRWNAALNPAAVAEIRASSESYGSLSEKYSVSKSTICRVKRGVSWKHINPT